jgi:hypothetical protein
MTRRSARRRRTAWRLPASAWKRPAWRLSGGLAVRDRLAALERDIVAGRIDVTAGGVVEELA